MRWKNRCTYPEGCTDQIPIYPFLAHRWRACNDHAPPHWSCWNSHGRRKCSIHLMFHYSSPGRWATSLSIMPQTMKLPWRNWHKSYCRNASSFLIPKRATFTAFLTLWTFVCNTQLISTWMQILLMLHLSGSMPWGSPLPKLDMSVLYVETWLSLEGSACKCFMLQASVEQISTNQLNMGMRINPSLWVMVNPSLFRLCNSFKMLGPTGTRLISWSIVFVHYIRFVETFIHTSQLSADVFILGYRPFLGCTPKCGHHPAQASIPGLGSSARSRIYLGG